jgi:hypothetical protein
MQKSYCNTLFMLLIAMFTGLSLVSCDDDDNNQNNSNYTVTMGSGYASDIYYSCKNGVVTTVDRSNWDIAFATNPMQPVQSAGATIITNGAAGVELYPMSLDSLEQFNSIDTADLTDVTVQYNSDTSWYLGAFQKNSTGGFNYGWGNYNPTSHNIDGNKGFVIKCTSGMYHKLFVIQRSAMANTFYLSIGEVVPVGLAKSTAELTKTDSIPCNPYLDKRFVYYSITNKEIIDREPVSDDWDFVFTKYIGKASMGLVTIDYPMMGILTNYGVGVAEVSGVNVPVDQVEFNSTQNSVIGSDWKINDPITHMYSLRDSLYYYIKTRDDEIYKLTFESFDNVTATIDFQLVKIQ